MFDGFTEETIQFFLDLKFHNNSEFFHQHHDRYLEVVQKPFYELITDLAPAMKTIDPNMEIRPYKCLSRIHRDTRFSRDKSPYRDHLWFIFRREGEPREKSLMYYFEMGINRLDWGLGFWGENREVLDLFRKKMAANPDGTLALIDDLELDQRNMMLNGSAFKRLPVPLEIPQRLRRWYCSKEMFISKISPSFPMVFTDKVLQEVRTDFQCLAPLYRLLRGYFDQYAEETGSKGVK